MGKAGSILGMLVGASVLILSYSRGWYDAAFRIFFLIVAIAGLCDYMARIRDDVVRAIIGSGEAQNIRRQALQETLTEAIGRGTDREKEG